MSLFSLLEKDVKLPPNKKIISEKEFSTLKKASEILKTVKKEALEYKKEIFQEAEILKKQAYEEGYTKGLEELNEKILIFNEKIEKFEKELQKKILPVALKAAKKIIGEELRLHEDRIVDIVIQSLKPVLQHHKIKIYANKQDIDILEKNKDRIKKILQQVKTFVIEERDDIERGGCIIETEAGIINAQLENQWQALEAAFEKFMKK